MLNEKSHQYDLNDQTSSFEELIAKDNSFTVTNLSLNPSLSIQVGNNMAATIIDDLFSRSYYNYIIVLLFQACFLFIMVKILYSITVPLNMLPHYIEDSGTLHVSKVKSENGNLLIAHLVSAKKYQILVSKIRSDSMYLLFAYDAVCM